MCSTAIRTPDGPFPWRYARVEVRFSASEIPADGHVISYRYLGYRDSTTLIAIADCEVPASSEALRRVDRLLNVRRAEARESSGISVLAVTLEGLTVVACGPGYTGEWPSCLPNPTPVEIPGETSGGGFWYGGGGSDAGSSGAEAPSLEGDTVPTGQIPDCNQPQVTPWDRAYCRSAVPSGARLERTDSAFARIARRAGPCAEIAAFGRSLLSAGNLRYFGAQDGDTGGWGAPGFGVILADYWVDRYGLPTNPMNRNLDITLVHEIEHAMGREHIDAEGLWTPNARQCAGLSS